MELGNKIFGGIITMIMIVAIGWSASILFIPNDDPSKFDFLTEEQIDSIKQLESLCSDYSASSKMICMDTVDSEISKFQVKNVSQKAMDLNDVALCHSISSDVDCLLEVAQKSNNKDACYAIVNSHQKIEDTEEKNTEYLKSLQGYCLSRYVSS